MKKSNEDATFRRATLEMAWSSILPIACLLATPFFMAGANMGTTLGWSLAVAIFLVYPTSKSTILGNMTRLLWSYHEENGTFGGISFSELLQNHLTREFVIDQPKDEVLHRALCGLNQLKSGSNLVLDWEGGSLRARASTTGAAFDLSELLVKVSAMNDTQSKVVIHGESLSRLNHTNQNNIQAVKVLERAIKTEQDASTQIKISTWRKTLAPALRFTIFRSASMSGLIIAALIVVMVGDMSQAQSRARSLYQAGHYQEVLNHIAGVRNVSQDNLQIAKALSLAHLNKGMEAQEVLTKLIGETKESSSAEEYKAELAYVYALNKNESKATELLKELDKATGYSVLARTHFIKAVLNEDAGKPEIARREYDRALGEVCSTTLSRDVYERSAANHRNSKDYKEAAEDESVLNVFAEEASNYSPIDDGCILLYKLLFGVGVAASAGVAAREIRRIWLRNAKLTKYTAPAVMMPEHFEHEESFDVNQEFEACFDRCLQAISETGDLRVSDIGAESGGTIKVSNATGDEMMTLKLVSIADTETRLVIQTCNSDADGLEKLKLKLMS